jgi:branched-chain amino acid transport system substrate-binding protein
MIRNSFGSRHLKEAAKRESRPSLPFAFCILPFALLFCLLSLFSVLCFAQEPKPYAAINRDAVNYNGPGRDTGHDLAGTDIRLGLLAPLAGPRQTEGEALGRAAQIAIDEENATSLPAGRRLVLVRRDESGPWGQASAEIVHLVFDDQVVALITSAEGGAAHLAEQVGNKVGIPILTLSTDATTTEINLPWIFRLGPADTAQAQAFARDIYSVRQLQRVVLLTENDHDGRMGGEEFEKAARQMNAPAPARIALELEKSLADSSLAGLANAQAVVIWADAAAAKLLVARVRETLPSVPIYLCRKAVQGNWSALTRPHCRTCADGDAGIWTAEAPDGQAASRRAFEQRYRQRFGSEPGMGAAQAYDAVRVLAAAVRQSGPNRARLRDALAQVSAFPGAAGLISFDHAGNDLTAVTLTRLP